MKRNRILAVIFGLATLFVLPIIVRAQENRPIGERPGASIRRTQPAEPESPATSAVPMQGNQAAAPRLMKVSGVLTELVRNSVSSSVEMTFAVYKDEVGGEALWTETQNVEVDKEGHYTVLLGVAQADGVPVELFPAGEPRWLGVEIRGQAPQSRTLLVSVPYALKALDAEKLSGKSLSDFVLSESLSDQVRRVVEGQTIVANGAATHVRLPIPALPWRARCSGYPQFEQSKDHRKTEAQRSCSVARPGARVCSARRPARQDPGPYRLGERQFHRKSVCGHHRAWPYDGGGRNPPGFAASDGTQPRRNGPGSEAVRDSAPQAAHTLRVRVPCFRGCDRDSRPEGSSGLGGATPYKRP